MASVDSTLHLGEVFLETADGTKISLGQLKAPFNITIEPPKAKALEVKIGSTVKISDNPMCACGLPSHKSFAGQTATVVAGPTYDAGGTDWYVEHAGNKNWISSEHLTVVS